MSTEPQNAPVTEAHEKLLREIYAAVDPAKLIANFVASETAALREQLENAEALTMCVLRRERDALAAQCALLRERISQIITASAELSKRSKPYLLFRANDMTTMLPTDELWDGDRWCVVFTYPNYDAAINYLMRRNTTPETASAELAELRKDKALLDDYEKLRQDDVQARQISEDECEPELLGHFWPATPTVQSSSVRDGLRAAIGNT